MINWKCNICDAGFEEPAEDADGIAVCPICGEGCGIVRADLCQCGKAKELEFPLCDDCRKTFYRTSLNSFLDDLNDGEQELMQSILTDGLFETDWYWVKK